MPKELPSVRVRMTAADKRKVEAAATKDNRSASAWVLQLIRRELQEVAK